MAKRRGHKSYQDRLRGAVGAETFQFFGTADASVEQTTYPLYRECLTKEVCKFSIFFRTMPLQRWGAKSLQLDAPAVSFEQMGPDGSRWVQMGPDGSRGSVCRQQTWSSHQVERCLRNV